MIHRAEIVEIKQLANTALAFCCRCCQDPATDSWHTIYLRPEITDADIEAEIESHREHVEAKHDAMHRARQLLDQWKVREKA